MNKFTLVATRIGNSGPRLLFSMLLSNEMKLEGSGKLAFQTDCYRVMVVIGSELMQT